jgi:hypothetical protein
MSVAPGFSAPIQGDGFTFQPDMLSPEGAVVVPGKPFLVRGRWPVVAARVEARHGRDDARDLGANLEAVRAVAGRVDTFAGGELRRRQPSG